MYWPVFVPLMARPGCRPPYTNIYARTRVTLPGQPASTDTTCALRALQAVPPPYINNTAVPSAEVLDGTTNFGTGTNANVLTSFFLGTLTQTQMMMKVDPTFVTVWLGNNDVLGAATSSTNAGDSTRITDTLTFASEYRAVLDSIGRTSAQGGVLIGVANVTLIFLQGIEVLQGQGRYRQYRGSGQRQPAVPGQLPRDSQLRTSPWRLGARSVPIRRRGAGVRAGQP